jgi:hypothetical protein
VFLGSDDLPDEQVVQHVLAAGDIFPIRMTMDEFLRFTGFDVEWVRVFVLGRLSEEDLTQLRDRFSHLSGSVLVAKPDAVSGWLQKLPFEKSADLMVYNRPLAQVLPVPRGSVRPELFQIFGAPAWPMSVRRNITLAFVVLLGLFALAMVIPRKGRAAWILALVPPVMLGGVLLLMLASMHPSAPAESVSLLELPEGAPKGVQTTFISRAVLTPAAGWRPLGVPDIPLFELNPVASSPTQWTEHMLFLDYMLRFEQNLPVPSRELFVRYSFAPVPPTAADFFETDGEHVWVYKKTPPPPAGPADAPLYQVSEDSFAGYLAARRHQDVRVDELQRGILKYWHSNLRRPGLYAIHLNGPAINEQAFSAGTLVVVKVAKHLSEQWEHGVLGLLTEPPAR